MDSENDGLSAQVGTTPHRFNFPDQYAYGLSLEKETRPERKPRAQRIVPLLLNISGLISAIIPALLVLLFTATEIRTHPVSTLISLPALVAFLGITAIPVGCYLLSIINSPTYWTLMLLRLYNNSTPVFRTILGSIHGILYYIIAL